MNNLGTSSSSSPTAAAAVTNGTNSNNNSNNNKNNNNSNSNSNTNSGNNKDNIPPTTSERGATRFVPIQRKASVEEMGDKIVQMLDEIEKRVESLREAAQSMEYEKESLMEMLNTVQLNKDMIRLSHGDRDDIEATTDRLIKRCRTVDVQVNTPRNHEQQRALNTVNHEIESLLAKTKEDIAQSKAKAQTYLNACQPDQPEGPIDQKFQAIVIECTADDQKKIRRRLTNLLSLLDRTDKNIDIQYV